MAFTLPNAAGPRAAAPELPVIPQHFIPPTQRELRAQAVHRLQVGMFGLAGMVLLVGLANIIMDRARVSEDATAEAAAASAAAAQVGPESAASGSASDPLADIGVVPEMPQASATPTPVTRDAARDR